MQGRVTQHEAALDLDPATLGRPKIPGSILLHLGFIAAIVGGSFASHFIHHNEWGNQQAPGAIQATLVSSPPALPLPQDTPPTPNVLATETPSPAPAPSQPKVVPIPPPDAIPIVKKEPPPKKEPPKKEPPPSPKYAQPQPQPQQYRAQYGEAPATQTPRTMAPTTPGPQAPVTIGGSQGFNYPWYVNLIQSKVAQSWYIKEVDPHTPVGSVTKVTFTISRDGSASGFRISQSSGFPTLDSSALRAVERVDNFSSLPSGYSKSTLFVEYTFTYAEH